MAGVRLNTVFNPTALLLSALVGCAVVFIRDTLAPHERLDSVTAVARFVLIPPLRFHPHLLAVRDQLDPSIPVGAQKCVAFHRMQRLRRWAPIAGAGGYAEQHQWKAQPGNPIQQVG